MGVQTATVETLTAEVRVLMVGSRQITLSVAKQLDHCRYSDMLIMGRVKLNDDTELIGRNVLTGELMLAQFPLRSVGGGYLWVDGGFDQPPRRCSVLDRRRGGTIRHPSYVILDHEQRIYIARNVIEWCETTGTECDCSLDSMGWLPTCLARTRRAIENLTKDREDAMNQPLVVLAGLR